MSVYEIVIDDKRCKGCSICVTVCPKQCLAVQESFNESGYYYPAMTEGAECTGCGACVKLCPDFAVTVYEVLDQAG